MRASESGGLGPSRERYLELREQYRQDRTKEMQMEILNPISQKSVPTHRNNYNNLLDKIQSLPKGKAPVSVRNSARRAIMARDSRVVCVTRELTVYFSYSE